MVRGETTATTAAAGRPRASVAGNDGRGGGKAAASSWFRDHGNDSLHRRGKQSAYAPLLASHRNGLFRTQQLIDARITTRGRGDDQISMILWTLSDRVKGPIVPDSIMIVVLGTAQICQSIICALKAKDLSAPPTMVPTHNPAKGPTAAHTVRHLHIGDPAASPPKPVGLFRSAGLKELNEGGQLSRRQTSRWRGRGGLFLHSHERCTKYKYIESLIAFLFRLNVRWDLPGWAKFA